MTCHHDRQNLPAFILAKIDEPSYHFWHRSGSMRVLLVLCLVVLSWPIQAATVSFSSGLGFGASSPDSRTMPKFDPALGTLNSVLFDMSLGQRTPNETSYLNTSNQPQIVNYLGQQALNCCGPGPIGVSGVFTAVCYGLVGGTQTSFGVFEIPANAAFAVSSFFPNISVASAPGLPLNFYIATAMSDSFEIAGEQSEIISWDNPAIMQLAEITDPLIDVSITVSYEFTPVSEIPLPAAFWLLISGLLALVPFLRHRAAP